MNIYRNHFEITSGMSSLWQKTQDLDGVEWAEFLPYIQGEMKELSDERSRIMYGGRRRGWLADELVKMMKDKTSDTLHPETSQRLFFEWFLKNTEGNNGWLIHTLCGNGNRNNAWVEMDRLGLDAYSSNGSSLFPAARNLLEIVVRAAKPASQATALKNLIAGCATKSFGHGNYSGKLDELFDVFPKRCWTLKVVEDAIVKGVVEPKTSVSFPCVSTDAPTTEGVISDMLDFWCKWPLSKKTILVSMMPKLLRMFRLNGVKVDAHAYKDAFWHHVGAEAQKEINKTGSRAPLLEILRANASINTLGRVGDDTIDQFFEILEESLVCCELKSSVLKIKGKKQKKRAAANAL
jgi:hypothetical protein